MERMILVGTEDVLRASNNMSSAASNMIRAASIMSEIVASFATQVDRLEQLLERAKNELPQGQ